MTAGPGLRINRVSYPVTALGPGRRLGVWVQGCPLACRGCMSRDTWDPAAGVETTVGALAAAWRQAVLDGAAGLTLSGGEPLAEPDRTAALLAAVDAVRREVTAPGGPAAGRELDILVYTGYDEAELDDRQRAAARLADVLITGRFEAGAPTRLIWRGSANQRMVLRTPLGRRRYAEYVDHAPDRVPLQVVADRHDVWLVGVPRRGDLGRIERALSARGLAVDAVSWRPPHPAQGS